MGVYIQGMQIPKEHDEMIEIVIFGNGKTLQTGESWRSLEDGKCYYTTSNNDEVYESIEIPDGHGRLIDAEALDFSVLTDSICQKEAEDVVDDAPTVIPAERRKHIDHELLL